MIKHKKLSLLTLLLAAAVFLAGSALTDVLAVEMPVLLSLEELAEFNGKDGKPAYVAVDGIIYDVTASRAWGNGNHNGFEAGKDLTKEIKEVSPHGVGKLANVVEIGRVKVELTLEQLKEFNGKDGKPAYVAVDGIIYDMTASRAWGNGNHNGFEAGNDLTKEIREVSPHGVGKLENVIEIGRIIQELTVEQLSAFNGRDGKPAYIAVDGVIYDVTESSAWEGGGHKGLEAGLDLTAEFKDSPHDVSTLDKINKIGILIP
jgi:predicted heme/steroid binding protein